jgi:hypothetical protein
LLSLEPQAEAAAFVARFLDSGDEAIAEAAALALGSPATAGVRGLKDSWSGPRKPWRIVPPRSSWRSRFRTGPATEFLSRWCRARARSPHTGRASPRSFSTTTSFEKEYGRGRGQRGLIASEQYESEPRRNRISVE